MTSPVISWLSDSAIEILPTSVYWNDTEIERQKTWYVENTDDLKVIQYVQENTNLEQDFLAGIRFLEDWLGHELRGVCLDLGAGVCWTSAILAKKSQVERIYAVEMSKHRLLELAPIVLEQYGAPAQKVTRVLGDFCDIKLDDGSVDVVVMAQAFHHAADVRRLMREIVRVLAPGGGVIATGEKPLPRGRYLCRLWRYNIRGLACVLHLDRLFGLLRGRKVTVPEPLFSFDEEYLFLPDPKKGDRVYRATKVREIFQEVGLDICFQWLEHNPKKIASTTCNYVGLKPKTR